eukprot:2672461-Rhodomonas_salina.1
MSYSSHAWKLVMMIMMLGAAASMKMPIAVVRTFSVFPPSQSMKLKVTMMRVNCSSEKCVS